MIVVDSSVWIANLRNIATDAVRKLDGIKATNDILVGDLILLEVLQGARDVAHANRLEAGLRMFAPVQMMNVDIAVAAAGNYRKLRSLGFTVRKTADLIIATYCIIERHSLLHDDRDFDPFAKHLGLHCL